MKKWMSLLLILLAGFAYAQDEQDQEAQIAASFLTQIGDVAPDFTVTTLAGDTVTLSALKGKVVLLNFFATWCPPCQAEMPHLEMDIWQEFKDKAFTVISIAREHTREEAAAFKKEKEVTFPMGYDTDRSIYAQYASGFIPRNYIIDQKGTIVFQEVGFDEEKLAKLVKVIEGLL